MPRGIHYYFIILYQYFEIRKYAITFNSLRVKSNLTMDIKGHSGRSVMSACGHSGTIKSSANIMERWTQWNVAVVLKCPAPPSFLTG